MCVSERVCVRKCMRGCVHESVCVREGVREVNININIIILYIGVSIYDKGCHRS